MTVKRKWQVQCLKNNDVHIWLINLDSLVNSLSLHAALRGLPEVEQKRALSSSSKKWQRQFVYGRNALRTIISRYYLPLSATQLNICIDQCGKPYLSHNHVSLHFNLSHSANMLALVLSTSANVGVDIERHNEKRNFKGIAENFFHKFEKNALRATPDSHYLQQFYTFWTLKEALLKALGSGLKIPLNSFGFSLYPTITLSETPTDANFKNWHFESMKIEQQFSFSVALEKITALSPVNTQIYHFSLDG